MCEDGLDSFERPGLMRHFRSNISCVIYFSQCDEMMPAISQGIPFL